MSDPCFDSEYDIVLKRYRDLKNQIVNVIDDKENLLKHKFYNLKTEYITKIGYLEYELSNLNINISLTKRKIELIQSDEDQNESINLQFIELEVNKEFKEFMDMINIKKREIEIANYLNNIEKLTDSHYLELNKCFRSLINILHPDINPNSTEVQKNLWEKGSIAYDNGDVEFMNVILKLAKDESMVINVTENYSREELDSKIEYFEVKIKDETSEIKVLQKKFPFNKEEILMDEIKIKSIVKELKKDIKAGNNMLKIMEEHFLLILGSTRYIN